MKISFIMIILFLLGCDNQTSRKSVSKLTTFEDSTSYSIGADLGSNLKRQNVGVDYDVFLAGLIDGMELPEEDAKLNQKERREIMSTLQNRIREKEKNQGGTNLQAAEEFLAKNKKGYHNLAKMSSIAYVEGFYYVPRIDREVVEKYKDDLIVLTGNLHGEVPSKILNIGKIST